MISILCPTRNRPKEFSRMIQSALETALNPANVEVLAYVDEDDKTQFSDDNNLIVKRGPRQTLTKCWNDLIPLAKGDIFLQGNDDVVFKTPGWDEMVEDAFAESKDKLLMVHGDDLAFGRDKAAAHPFVHREWYNTLGYFIPPYFSSDYGDTWVNELANGIGRRKYLPFVLEHMHHMIGKAKIDKTTQERLERHKADEVERLYAELLPERLNDLAKLQAKLRNPVWSILILTQPSRKKYLAKLMDNLRPQLEGKPVELLFKVFDKRLTLGHNRELLRSEARGKYICFVDDDDLVAKNYVAKILPVLQKDSVDYVGFNVQCYVDGTALPVTRHSLRYPEWGSDQQGAYRDISHLNPIRKDLAMQAAMEGGFGEDHRWADALRVKGVVKLEKYINEVMYLYYSRTVKEEEESVAAVIRERQQHPQEGTSTWRPTHFQCPACKSTCIIQISGGLRCNQCGNQFQ